MADSIPEGNQCWDAEVADPSMSCAPYKIYNIGNSRPVKLMDFIRAIEMSIGRKLTRSIFRCSLGMCIRPMRILLLFRGKSVFNPIRPWRRALRKQ